MSSLRDRLHSVLGTEDLGVDVVASIPVEDQAVVVADGVVANAEVVVAEHEKEITEAQSDIEVIEERLDDIEANVEGLESMLSGETEWNPALAMKMYQDARKLTDRTFGAPVKSVMSTANVKGTESFDENGEPAEVETFVPRFAIDGVESFADATTAQLTMIEGLEDIKEKAAAAGTAIVNFFKNLYKSVISAFVGLFDRLKGISSRSDALISKLSTIADDKIKDTIKLGKWNAFLKMDASSDPIKSVGNVAAIANRLGEALNASKGESAKTIIDNVLSAIGNAASEKKTVTSSAEQTTSVGTIAYIEFRWTVPKTLAALRSASLSYKIAEGAKTSGELKTGYGKSKLIVMAKSIKSAAASAQTKTFSASSLNGFREKAINAVKAVASRGDERKDAQAIRAAHVASNNIGRVLTRYQGDVLSAGQQFIAAHF